MASSLKNTFAALSIHNYRRFFFGNGFSALGSWMQRLGMSWLVYRLTGSTTWLGTIVFFSWFSSFLLMPWSGVLLDSGSRRKLLMYSQILGFAQAMLLAILTWYELASIPWLIFLSLMLGLVNAFDMPGRHAFVSDMVTQKAMLSNAIALNSIAFNLARLAGPAIAGFIVANWGEALCFLINSLSFLPFAYVLFTMKIESEAHRKTNRESFKTKVTDGFRYAAGHQLILPVLLLLSTASLMAMPIQMVLFPVIADKILGGGAQTLGYLSAAVGFGAVCGAFGLARRKSIAGLERVPPKAFGTFGIMASCLAFSQNLWLSLFFATMMGACIVFGWSACNTLVQSSSTKEKRSRVMSIYMMCFSGMSPIGSLFLGWFSSVVGTPAATITGGTACLIGSIIFYLYIRRISPERMNELFNPE